MHTSESMMIIGNAVVFINVKSKNLPFARQTNLPQARFANASSHRSQLSICSRKETLSVAVCVSNPDRSPLQIQVEIVSDDFPVLHRHGCCLLIIQNHL